MMYKYTLSHLFKSMKITRLCLASLLLLTVFGTACAQPAAYPKDTALVQELRIPSKVMRKDFGAQVILPEAYFKNSALRFPVVYLLHGYSGNYTNWLVMQPRLRQWASLLNCIIAMPEGGYGSWYFDSPIDPASQYETYVSKEVVDFVDTQYRTIPSREGRAIAGLSMGGHGALYLALRHPEVYGAAGSMSGGVDLRPFPKNWEIAKHIGSLEEFPERWEAGSVINNLFYWDETKPIKLIIDCGTEDFFFGVNLALHERLKEWHIPHEFTTRPGEHNVAYWKDAVFHQLLFFDAFFRE